MKRILAAALAAMLLVSGCGAAKTDGTSAASGQTVVSQAESAASSDTGIHPSLADGTYETGGDHCEGWKDFRENCLEQPVLRLYDRGRCEI